MQEDPSSALVQRASRTSAIGAEAASLQTMEEGGGRSAMGASAEGRWELCACLTTKEEIYVAWPAAAEEAPWEPAGGGVSIPPLPFRSQRAFSVKFEPMRTTARLFVCITAAYGTPLANMAPAEASVRKVNLADAFSKINEPWSPHVVGDVNECQLKLATMTGEFVWHHHEDEDECFIVIKGQLNMKFRDGDVIINPGELIVVPKTVEHCPVAVSDTVECLLVERGETLNTGSAAGELGQHVHEQGTKPLTKRTLPRL
jgi:mannose-6-phosphate isomerase-like protein (cupin superfamily)